MLDYWFINVKIYEGGENAAFFFLLKKKCQTKRQNITVVHT